VPKNVYQGFMAFFKKKMDGSRISKRMLTRQGEGWNGIDRTLSHEQELFHVHLLLPDQVVALIIFSAQSPDDNV